MSVSTQVVMEATEGVMDQVLVSTQVVELVLNLLKQVFVVYLLKLNTFNH